LAVPKWGYDFTGFIYKNTGMTTMIDQPLDLKLGLEGEFLDVFIGSKGFTNPKEP